MALHATSINAICQYAKYLLNYNIFKNKHNTHIYHNLQNQMMNVEKCNDWII